MGWPFATNRPGAPEAAARAQQRWPQIVFNDPPEGIEGCLEGGKIG